MSLLPLAFTLHLLSAVIWVGGMFFAYMALRPAAGGLDPQIKTPLWSRTFALFFPWVWAAVILLLATGYWMLFRKFGSFANAPFSFHIMHALGIGMMLIFFHVFFAPYRRMQHAIESSDFTASVRELAQIRKLVAFNLTLGLIVIIIAGGGRFWM